MCWKENIFRKFCNKSIEMRIFPHNKYGILKLFVDDQLK